MIVLGLDPGTQKTGFGIVEKVKRSCLYQASDVISHDASLPFMERIGQIHESILDLAKKFQVCEVAFESVIFVKDVQALAKIAQARGAMMAALYSVFKKKIHEYSPAMVKAAVTGSGKAGKQEVARGVAWSLGLKNPNFKTDDESDALAIAICHIHSMNYKKSLERTN